MTITLLHRHRQRSININTHPANAPNLIIAVFKQLQIIDRKPVRPGMQVRKVNIITRKCSKFSTMRVKCHSLSPLFATNRNARRTAVPGISAKRLMYHFLTFRHAPCFCFRARWVGSRKTKNKKWNSLTTPFLCRIALAHGEISGYKLCAQAYVFAASTLVGGRNLFRCGPRAGGSGFLRPEKCHRVFFSFLLCFASCSPPVCVSWWTLVFADKS